MWCEFEIKCSNTEVRVKCHRKILNTNKMNRARLRNTQDDAVKYIIECWKLCVCKHQMREIIYQKKQNERKWEKKKKKKTIRKVM